MTIIAGTDTHRYMVRTPPLPSEALFAFKRPRQQAPASCSYFYIGVSLRYRRVPFKNTGSIPDAVTIGFSAATEVVF